jgi:hypothetical protein
VARTHPTNRSMPIFDRFASPQATGGRVFEVEPIASLGRCSACTPRSRASSCRMPGHSMCAVSSVTSHAPQLRHPGGLDHRSARASPEGLDRGSALSAVPSAGRRRRSHLTRSPCFASHRFGCLDSGHSLGGGERDVGSLASGGPIMRTQRRSAGGSGWRHRNGRRGA